MVKLAACLSGQAPSTYLIEWYAAALGRALGLNIPEPFEVLITQPFAMSLDRPWRELALQSLGSAYGSAHRAGGYTQWLPGTLIPLDLRDAAVELVAFDVLIHNPDRRVENPNVLASRDALLAFDHDTAFSFLFQIGGGDPVEDPLLTEVVDRHVFAQGLGKKIPSLENFRARVAGLTDEQLEAMGRATPSAWQAGNAAGKLDKIVEVMQRRRDAIDRWLPQVEARIQR